ncbi:hypothetical protein PIROE2DRAFT_61860 [Piromyces sp. E2]|nr:hypothetical protein PIROE2DRAFT_61860 [Piromyces sp. E2]|eukprot:OUM62504.1 hypothetical protein PIROE2DRAFT_61860 [Piromyces sp. E2]
MRLSINILALISATTVFADYLTDVLNNFDISAISDCKNALDEYRECQIDTLNLDSVGANIDNFCNIFATEKCQSFYKQGIARIPACQNISKEIFTPGQLLTDMIYSFLKLGCSKDENGNYCPLAGQKIISNAEMSEEQLMNLVNESCKSKQCHTIVSNTFTGVENVELLTKLLFKKQMNDLNMNTTPNESIEKINNLLQSENCTSQHTIRTADSTANANSDKFNTILLIGLTILLSLLF